MIAIQNLHYGYGKKRVFEGLSLGLQGGRIYGLLGKNGTGKSTLLRNIAGLLFPDQGSIRVLGQDPGRRKPSFLREVALVPEEFYFPNIKVDAFVTANAPFYPRFSRTQFDTYFREFSIPEGQTLQHMSYGQKKKVLISFALACNTQVLLMDEPTNGLDIMSKSQFRKVMAGAVSDNKCVVISTHQVKDLENLIDRITIIDQGHILFDQDVTDISRRLSFQMVDSDAARHAVYAEQALKGFAAILPNTDSSESRLDLELLYKAIILEPEKVRKVFAATDNSFSHFNL
jgi:ABC-2 type transport system ATP-binding protein